MPPVKKPAKSEQPAPSAPPDEVRHPASCPEVDVNVIAQRLGAPFDTAEVKFKPQTISGNRALAVAFVDARVIQDRLDDVLGVLGWQDSYECLPDGAVVCRLKIRLGDEWITKEDVGGQSEQPDEGDRRKAAFSDALKRAAVKFGIGRYLYRLKPQWVDYDPQKRRFTQQPVLPAGAPVQAATVKAERSMEELVGKLEARLIELHLCQQGELKLYLVKSGKFRGPIQEWDAASKPDIIRLAQQFREERLAKKLIGDEELKALEALLGQKDETFSRVAKALDLPKGTRIADLTMAQHEVAMQKLGEMPDRKAR